MSGAPQLVEPDDVPGPFYVSVFDGGRFLGLLSGPYTRHRDAVALVDRARKLAEAIDPRAFWWSVGTVRMRPEFTGQGALQRAGYALDLSGEVADVG